MVMQRWDPFNEVSSLRRAMDRLLEESFVRTPATGRGGTDGFDLDVMEQEGNIVVKAALPGVKPEDINISVEKGILTIDGETREEHEQGEGRYYHRERRFGRFSRQITLPRAEHARPRQIPIRGSAQGQGVIEGTRADRSEAGRAAGTGSAALGSAQSNASTEKAAGDSGATENTRGERDTAGRGQR